MAAKDLKSSISMTGPGHPAAAARSKWRLRLAAPAGAPKEGSFNMPPAPPAADDDDDDEMKLPAAVLGRVLGLRALHEKREEVMNEYVKERAALEAKYREKIDPILQDRARVINGKLEPSLSHDDQQTVAKAGTSSDEDVKGVPDFWLWGCGRHDAFEGTIESDVAALGV